MYKLWFTGDLVTGFRRQEAISSLARLLESDPEEIRNRFFTGSPVEFMELEDKTEAQQWRKAFADAGALLIVLPADEATPGGSRYAGADPANIDVEEPTLASITARIPGIRRRNQAYMVLGVIALILALILILGAWIFT